MRQCPDCEEKDRVVIAGKVFCANCGTPWETADAQEETSYLEKVGLAEAPEAKPEPEPKPTATPAQSATPQMPVAAPALSPLSPASPAAAPVSTQQPLQTQAPIRPAVPLPSTMPIPAASGSTPAASVPVVLPKVSQPSVAPQSEVPTASAAQGQSLVPPPPVPTVPSQSPVVPLATASQPMPAAQPQAAPEMQERVASEIPSLDSKEESVLSDTQLSAMSQAASTSNPQTLSAPVASPSFAPNSGNVSPTAAPAGPKTLVDIAPRATGAPVSVPTALPAIPKPVQASVEPVPAPQAVPTPSSSATVADPKPALTREDALKLALSDPAPAAQPVASTAAAQAQAATPAPAQPQSGGAARPLALVMSAMAFILLGAYLWQSNYPSFALKLASVRSGVEAAAPGYLPNGWNVTRDVTSASGSLVYKLQNKDRTMTISQQRSDWDSQALLEQFVLAKSQEYLALQAQGLTIYVYSQNQAAWVNHGVMYKIEGDHGLDQDQIIRIATSL